jgi:hypothetical protein
MSLDDWKNIFSIVQSVATILALAVGGVWAYTKFVYRREKEPRAEVDIDLGFVGIQDKRRLVEVSVYLENKGDVRHPVRNLRVDLLYLLNDETVSDGDSDINYQIKFPHSIKRVLWDETHIDSHLRYRNSYITAIPLEATFVLVFAKFEYKNESFPSQKLFKVPSETIQS